MKFSSLTTQIKNWWLSLDWRQATYSLFVVLIIVVTFILLLVYFFLTNNELIRGIITNLLSSIVGFLISSLFYSKILDFESKQRDEQLILKITNEINTSLRNFNRNDKVLEDMKKGGLVKITKNFSSDSLEYRIYNASSRIFILENWICNNLYLLEDAFRQAKDNKVKMQILLLDPNSEFAVQRSKDLGQADDYVSCLINGNINVIKNLARKLQLDDIELRYHNSLPSLQIFIFDDNAFVGFYLQNTESHNNPQLDILIKNEKKQTTIFGDRIIKHYETIWNKARVIQLY